MAGSLLVISGPSGAGKSSLISEILRQIPHAVFSVSTTTRAKREGEEHGVNYFYTDKESFQNDIKNGFFLEWANVHGNFYGTSIRQIQNAINDGKLVILDIDVQGFMQAKEKFSDSIKSVFVTTKNQSELKKRLLSRATDAHDMIQTRIKNAAYEMDFIDRYDFFVINDDFQTASEKLVSIAKGESEKRENIDKNEFIKRWFEN